MHVYILKSLMPLNDQNDFFNPNETNRIELNEVKEQRKTQLKNQNQSS